VPQIRPLADIVHFKYARTYLLTYLLTIRLPAVDFLWVVHCDHASIWHFFGMALHVTGEGRERKREKKKMEREKEKERKKGKGKGEGKKNERKEERE